MQLGINDMQLVITLDADDSRMRISMRNHSLCSSYGKVVHKMIVVDYLAVGVLLDSRVGRPIKHDEYTSCRDRWYSESLSCCLCIFPTLEWEVHFLVTSI